VCYVLVFTSDHIHPEESVVIGSMVRCHTHGFGVYFHVFGVCPMSDMNYKGKDQNQAFMHQRPMIGMNHLWIKGQDQALPRWTTGFSTKTNHKPTTQHSP